MYVSTIWQVKIWISYNGSSHRLSL